MIRFLTVSQHVCLPSAEFCTPSLCVCSASSFSSLPCCIVSVWEASAPWLASTCGLAETEVVSVAPVVAELWDPGRELLLLGPWAWLVVLLVVVLLVVVGVLGGFSTLCCLDPIGDWLSFSVAVSDGLFSAFDTVGSSGWLAKPRALPAVWELAASTWVMVCTDSVEAPDDLSKRRSSLDACSSSRMGDSSVSVKTSSENEPSVLRGAVLPLSLVPGSFRRWSGSFCCDGCLSAGRGSRSLETLSRTSQSSACNPQRDQIFTQILFDRLGPLRLKYGWHFKCFGDPG